MVIDSRPFNPDWSCSPWVSVRDRLDELGWSQVDLADGLGISEQDLSDLMMADLDFSSEMCAYFASTLGGSQGFWERLSANYQARCILLGKTSSY